VVIGPEVVITGELKSSGDLIIRGRVEGRVETASTVVIEAGAAVKAEVVAAAIVVRGRAEGALLAPRIEIEAEAVVASDVRTEQLSVALGAAWTGRLEMPVRNGPAFGGPR
jgi:cytoskeletal protein CcmA (bactofilin family)